VPSLQVAGEHDERLLVQDGAVVHVTERPILVPVGDELVQLAWRVPVMARVTTEAGVQYPHVDEPLDRGRIPSGKVVDYSSCGEALTMHRQPGGLEHDGPGTIVRKHMDVREL
jgi:hypothetical protein